SAEERAALQQRYTQSRQELKALITRKKQVDRDLAALESQIYKQETAYLEETQQGGNLVRGFDGYLKGIGNTRKSTFNEADRLFSLSSVSFSEA
ncbi:histone acetyltransferase subunit NuA4-domain-containing protein, partial [Protomyces lactucae-debilis]